MSSAAGGENEGPKKKGLSSGTDDFVDWEKLNSMAAEVPRPRRRGKLREIPEYYFLPKKSFLGAIGFYGAFVLAGLATGMIGGQLVHKKVSEDAAVVLEPPKSERSTK
eukprot:TRINITY_DN3201_c0_g1_i1.p1 TRINITY_DN3201_c0_g1~~TRINITY_DN3201_c0_g1_i1.p1  ORF type:complete len:108 (+),score=26.75 TRINITY_DN3201_c0_g1_i1:282-605(+)